MLLKTRLSQFEGAMARRTGARRRHVWPLCAAFAAGAVPCTAQDAAQDPPAQNPPAQEPGQDAAQDEPDATPPTQASTPQTPPPRPAGGPPQLPPPLSLSLRANHTLEANIDGGGKMSTSAASVRFGVFQPLSEQFFLSLSVGAGARTFDFKGDSGLVPGSDEEPWDTAHIYSLGISGTYRPSRQITIFGGLNGSSSGESGADFEDSLSGGVSGGVAWSASEDLTIGIGGTAQTRLEDSVLVIPFPTVDWRLPGDPQRRWRLQIGRVEAGPPTAAGAAISFDPIDELSLFAGVGFGFGDDFRLDDDGPAPGGVGRGSTIPLIAGFDWRASEAVRLSAYAGVTAYGRIELLDASGDRLGRRGVDAAPTVGFLATFRF